MRGLPKLKVNFEYEKRQKEKPMKVPKAHTLNLGRMRKLVLLLLVGLFLYFGFVLIKANAIARSNTVLRHDVVTLNKQLDQASAGTTSYNPIVGQYLASFLTDYYTVTTDSQSDRSSKLSQYFAKNISLPNAANNTHMKLVSAKLNGIFTVDNIKTAQYSLTVESDKKQTDMTVNVPYVQENTKLTVVGLPYVANTIDSIGHVGSARFQKSSKQLTDSDTVTTVKKFTKQFVQKYVSSSTKDMSLLMANPVGLNGSVDLTTLDESNIQVSGTPDKPVVTATMTVQVHGTNMMQTQTIRLELTKQSSTYFVTKFVQA
ncbi:conjugal transfer protein [Leuconostoc gelidum subsp. gasicomitatum]|uniref:conjugal transfer protein n=1 Tax=Leuconostoc gasicomitatum TaxID=115778 RepID=UPI001CC35A91|nr:conjugal transfer protein [Leuconostoc gasicomitatum]MBZ5961365.1 conjugal transfer protein [Leuconostoc gasicomitatum]MBZ5994647.1 conjugal transfer protein [Leuconostoc gasicomitatum]